MSGYLILIIFFLGLIFGSLGSVVMTRFADGVTRENLRGFFFGRSVCPQCKHTLHAKNLIPVVSYLVQGGKCAYCKKKIPRIYPVLEILTAVVFVGTYLFLQDFGTKTLVVGLLTNWLLILLLVYDLQKYELHMIVRILLTALGIVANVNISGGSDGNFLMSTVVFGVTFLAIYLFAKRYVYMRFKKHEEGFGQGDVFLAVSIGVFFPLIFSLYKILFSWTLLVNVLILFTLLSSIIGLLGAGVYMLITKKATKIIPFFPAMILAFWIMARKLPFLLTLIYFPW